MQHQEGHDDEEVDLGEGFVQVDVAEMPGLSIVHRVLAEPDKVEKGSGELCKISVSALLAMSSLTTSTTPTTLVIFSHRRNRPRASITPSWPWSCTKPIAIHHVSTPRLPPSPRAINDLHHTRFRLKASMKTGTSRPPSALGEGWSSGPDASRVSVSDGVALDMAKR